MTAAVDRPAPATGRALDPRLRLGVLIPSTNTVVEPEYHAMAPAGVSVQTGRLRIVDPLTDSDAAFLRLVGQVRDALAATVDELMTCGPDRLALGMTAIAFLGGAAAEDRLAGELGERAGVPVDTGPAAMVRALERCGATRIAVLSPYQRRGEREVHERFAQAGLEVVGSRSLRSPTATSIAEVGPGEVRALVHALDGPRVQAVVQVGTNLAMVGLVAELERQLGKPVLAINAATLWAALRASGIEDRVTGFGRLLEEH